MRWNTYFTLILSGMFLYIQCSRPLTKVEVAAGASVFFLLFGLNMNCFDLHVVLNHSCQSCDIDMKQ